MAKKVYNKLVRDNIPEIIRDDNAEPLVRKLETEEYIPALKAKLVEEAHEVENAQSNEVVKELADIYEILRTLADKLDLSLKEIEQIADGKKKKRGGFEEHIFLESVDE